VPLLPLRGQSVSGMYGIYTEGPLGSIDATVDVILVYLFPLSICLNTKIHCLVQL
jgi:hypothetical protein